MDIGKAWQWIRRHWLALLIILLLIIPTAGFVLVSAALMLFTFWPVDYSKIVTPPIAATTRHIFLLAHGVHDSPASWTDPLKTTLEQQLALDEPTQVIALNWQHEADSTLRCAVNGKRIGEHLGERLASAPGLESVHLIGHSCGAFVIFGLCETLKQKRADIQIQTTFLDPVSIYPGKGWRYGVEHFGECADFSEAYIDREDTVPGSNELILQTHTFDVTAARHKTSYSQSPHVWPTHYYSLLVKTGKQPSMRESTDLWKRYPRGALERVDTLPQ